MKSFNKRVFWYVVFALTTFGIGIVYGLAGPLLPTWLAWVALFLVLWPWWPWAGLRRIYHFLYRG